VYDPPIWPNATMPDFQEIADGQLRLANGRALSFNPIITQDVNRLGWEAHAEESAWILGAPLLVEPEPGTEWPDNRTVAFGIYSRDPETKDVIYDPGYAPASVYPAVMVPVWQIAPIVTNEKAVMFNLHSEPNRMKALDDMLTYQVDTLTAILQLVQDSELRPSSILFAPVYDEFNGDTDALDKEVVGSVSVVFSWDDMLRKILPNYIKGMICVLKSSIGQEFTYSISGDQVTLMGEGDLHDVKYDYLEQNFKASMAGVNEEHAVVANLITYSLTMYPSQEFQDQYVTNKAAIYTAAVVLIFVCTAGLFLLYDYLVENRQQKTARLARQTSTIVDSMFPAAFRDRLYKSAASPGSTSMRRSSMGSEANTSSNAQGRRNSDNTHRASNTTGVKTGKRFSVNTSTLKQMDKFMKLNARSSNQNMDMEEDEPIADLFLDTSIMFSDIVGFTKWSSERSPHEVFKLLERLFWEFDDIAQRLNVFKLGTIGDCYIAVTGIPDPIDDHATLLTQFAFECRDKVRQVCSDLEAEGLDTAKLDMRFGIHSGAITAGILRGTKSRFELFGDTINTASRMESTGQAGKIQLSEETAELLRIDNKGGWLTMREDKVAAKGKGTLQTWWADPVEKRISFVQPGIGDDLTAENLESLAASNSEHYYNSTYEDKLGEDVETGKFCGEKKDADKNGHTDRLTDPLDSFVRKQETPDEDRSQDESC
jgi:class 3 adenylate cyclase